MDYGSVLEKQEPSSNPSRVCHIQLCANILAKVRIHQFFTSYGIISKNFYQYTIISKNVLQTKETVFLYLSNMHKVDKP